jgi:hypothetical protein
MKIFKRPVSVLLESLTFSGQVTSAITHTKTEGFWKTLAPHEAGVDPNGKVTIGRTWVTRDLSWKVLPATAGITIPVVSTPTGARPGYLYVLRCVAHVAELFKVGRTAREVVDRRKQLSSATGVPDEFHEVYHIQVGGDVAAEAAVHRALKPFRYKRNREFFRIDLATLTSVIDQVLRSISETGALPVAR